MQFGIRAHAAVLVTPGQLEHAEIELVETGQGNELELVAHRTQLALVGLDRGLVQIGFPVERGRAVIGHHLARMGFLDGLGEALGLFQVRLGGLPPQKVCHFGIGQAPLDAVFHAHAAFQAEEAFRCTACIEIDEFVIAFINIGVDQGSAFSVRTGDRDRGHAHDVGSQPRRIEVTLVLAGRDQHLAAQMPAFLLGCHLVLEMDAGSARLDEGFHDFKAVQRAAKAGFGVGHDWREPVTAGLAVF